MLRFAQIYRESELCKAGLQLYTKALFNWRKALSSSTDERTLYDFARKGLKNIDAIHRDLTCERFTFRPGLAVHHCFNGRHRTLYIYPWEERLVDVLLYRLLNQALNNWFSPRSYAYRLNGWGVDRCQTAIAKVVSSSDPIYVVKRDISRYFDSIDHEVLLDLLAGLVDRRDYLFELLRSRIAFDFVEKDRGIQRAVRGVPFGTAVACLFANVYLTGMDRRLASAAGVDYFRYADDLLALSRSRAGACEAAQILSEELEHLRLESKVSHEKDLLLTSKSLGDERFKSVQGFRHLGLEFRTGGLVRLSRDKSRKIRNLFRYAFRRREARFRKLKDPRKRASLACALARRVLEMGVRNVAIIDYYLRHVCDVEQIRQIDRWLAEEVLSIAFGGGHKKGYFKKISFAELRRLGLPSLVHRQRLIHHGHLRSPFFVWRNQQLERRKVRGAGRSGLPRGASQSGVVNPQGRIFSPSPEAVAKNAS